MNIYQLTMNELSFYHEKESIIHEKKSVMNEVSFDHERCMIWPSEDFCLIWIKIIWPWTNYQLNINEVSFDHE